MVNWSYIVHRHSVEDFEIFLGDAESNEFLAVIGKFSALFAPPFGHRSSSADEWRGGVVDLAWGRRGGIGSGQVKNNRQ